MAEDLNWQELSVVAHKALADARAGIADEAPHGVTMNLLVAATAALLALNEGLSHIESHIEQSLRGRAL